MNELKITTSHIDERLANVVLNGEDISSKITGLNLYMKCGKIPKALIEFPLSEIVVDGNFDVLTKIPQEESKDIKFKSNTTTEDVEEISKTYPVHFWGEKETMYIKI